MLCKRKPVVGVVIQEEFEDTKGVIRIRVSKKNRQHNGQKNMHKRQTAIYKIYSQN